MEDGTLGRGGDLCGKEGVIVSLCSGRGVQENEAGLSEGHDIAVLAGTSDVKDKGSVNELGKVRHETGESLLVSVREDRDETIASGFELGENRAKLEVLVELLDLELSVKLGGLVDNRGEGGGGRLAGRSDIDQGGRSERCNPGNGASSRD